MEWEMILHETDGYLEVVTGGSADRDGSLEMAKAISERMNKRRITRALIDHSHIAHVAGETVDIFDRPKILSLIGAVLKIKIAEVIKPEHREHFRFFETVCVNRGYRISVFEDRDSAIAWLLE
jgi:hypothetical protein